MPKEESLPEMDEPIYLDYQATTPLDPRVLDAMLPFFTVRFGNPSSVHAFGLAAADAVESARAQVARGINADPREVVFTSGATEANNLALKGLAAAGKKRRRLVTLATEHAAVLKPAAALASAGFDVTVLPVDELGMPDLDQLAAVVDDQTLVVSVAAANSEIGALLPLETIAEIVHRCGALLHTDAAQAVGKLPVDVDGLAVDLLSISGHKLYGPKGIGALYIRREHQPKLHPLLDGGEHERGLRSGTLNVPAIVGFGAAVELAVEELPQEAPRIEELRDRLLQQLQCELDGVAINGPHNRLPGNLNVRFFGVHGEALIANCPSLAFSAGSACSAGVPDPSHVLLALGLDHDAASECVRISLGRPTTEHEVDVAVESLVAAVTRVRSALNTQEVALR
jgi:cysteine desulfurase